MGQRGPVPKRPPIAAVSRPLRKVPGPPLDLGPAGEAEWQRVTAELGPAGRNVMTAVALGLLEDLARTVDDAERFRRAWRDEGLTVVGKGRQFAHPMIAAEREARRAINQLRRELGVTPGSALRVPSGQAPEEEEDDLSEFER